MNKHVLTVALLCCCFARAASTSPTRCDDLDCSDAKCGAIDCSCGSYRPACSCCDVCYQCSGQPCSLIPPTTCSKGACKLREGLSTAAALSSPGPHGQCP